MHNNDDTYNDDNDRFFELLKSMFHVQFPIRQELNCVYIKRHNLFVQISKIMNSTFKHIMQTTLLKYDLRDLK